MGREFNVFGEALVTVFGGAHLSGTPLHDEVDGMVSGAELGLSLEQIKIIPRFHHKDMHVDDFGPDVPPEVMWNLADIRISMTLVHYDSDILDTCMGESMGGGGFDISSGGMGAYLFGAGALMGNLIAPLASGNFFLGLKIVPNNITNQICYFPTCYLTGQPLEIPLGTQRSAVVLDWRSIPYGYPVSSGNLQSGSSQWEIKSQGAMIWLAGDQAQEL